MSTKRDAPRGAHRVVEAEVGQRKLAREVVAEPVKLQVRERSVVDPEGCREGGKGGEGEGGREGVCA